VRVLLVRDGQVLLVRHTYQKAWYLPGGGVKRGETLERAIRREAGEECGAQLGSLRFIGIYTDFVDNKTDHIALFLADEYSLRDNQNREIAEVARFPLNQLPGDTNPGSLRRVEAYRKANIEPVGLW
jgi:8-oxo-dGTP pyrophosphatase MutT (NUDIX family)